MIQINLRSTLDGILAYGPIIDSDMPGVSFRLWILTVTISLQLVDETCTWNVLSWSLAKQLDDLGVIVTLGIV